jgi:hypothetical protein
VGFGGWQERLPEEMELPDDSVVTLAPPAATVVLTPAEVESTRAAAERELERWRQPAEDDVHAALTDGDLARGQVLTWVRFVRSLLTPICFGLKMTLVRQLTQVGSTSSS